MMTPFDREIVARTAFMEASGEGREGMRAVIHAIFNRFKSGKWYGARTLAGVCLRGAQFSCWNTQDPNRLRMAQLAEDDPTLNLCRALTDEAANGDADPTGGATHYYSTSIMPPVWAKDGEKTAQIGRHIFYKGVP